MILGCFGCISQEAPYSDTIIASDSPFDISMAELMDAPRGIDGANGLDNMRTDENVLHLKPCGLLWLVTNEVFGSHVEIPSGYLT